MSRRVKPRLEAEIQWSRLVGAVRPTLLILGGILEFIALLLLSFAFFYLADAVRTFPPPDLLRSAYNSAGWGFLLAALGFPLLLGGFAQPKAGLK